VVLKVVLRSELLVTPWFLTLVGLQLLVDGVDMLVERRSPGKLLVTPWLLTLVGLQLLVDDSLMLVKTKFVKIFLFTAWF